MLIQIKILWILSQMAVERGDEMQHERDTDDDEELLSTADAARLLGVSPGTLELWRNTGRRHVPFVRMSTRRGVRYRRSDVLRFKASSG